MIKPTYLWALCKTCEDSKWIGDICRSLGGQEVRLDFGQKQVADMIKMDSEWMDERISWNREAARMRQARAREKRNAERLAEEGVSREVTPVTRDKRDKEASRKVTPSSRHPSVHPSIRPSIENNMEEEEDRDGAVAPPPPPPSAEGVNHMDPLVAAEAERHARPTEAQVENAALLMGITPDVARRWMEYMRQMDWRFTGGQEVCSRNFRTSLRRFASKALEEDRKSGGGKPSAPRAWTEADWALCAERCANCTGAGCGAGVDTPPPEDPQRPYPPEECRKFAAKEF